MNKEIKYTFSGAMQDVSKSKHPFQYYFEGQHIKILATNSQSTKSITNEKGNELVVTIPSISIDTITRTIHYGNKSLIYSEQSEINDLINNGLLSSTTSNQTIIGHVNTREGVILFTTDEATDCIWYLKDVLNSTYNLTLLYIRPLSFSKNNPIQAIFNYENAIIQKVYWVDGKNQLRFINIEHSIENGDIEELINLNSTSINLTGDYNLSQPIIAQITQGGLHTAGMIQYSYNLYKLNGAQTTIAPSSELISLDKGVSSGGGKLNEVVGSSPLINISNLDTRYTHIKVYAIKYTSFNEIPSISLIVEEEISNYNLFSYFDDGSAIGTLSLTEFLFLGSNVYIPKHIQSKDNRLFAASIKNKSFDFEIDARAYSYNNDVAPIAKLWEQDGQTNLNGLPSGPFLTVPSNYNISLKHDSINPDYDLYKYQSDGITIGGEGKFIKYQILQKQNLDTRYNRFFKDGEIYRIAIQFYNNLGQKSQPFWIADFKTPNGNLDGYYNTLSVELKLSELNAYIDSLNLTEEEKPIGYRIIRADRTANDRTILCQGGMTGMMVQTTYRDSDYSYWAEGDSINGNSLRRRDESIRSIKLPVMVNRGFQKEGETITHSSFINKYFNLRMLNYANTLGGPFGAGDGNNEEIFRSDKASHRFQNTWLYLKMMQLYSPDVLFNTGLSFNNTTKLNIRGAYERTLTSIINNKYDTRNENLVAENQSDELISPQNIGFYGPVRDDEDDETRYRNHKYYYNEYSNYISTNRLSNTPYSIYRAPEITERGQGITTYNNDSHFRYSNSLNSLLSDGFEFTDGQPEKNEKPLISANCYGAKCVTFVLGEENQDHNDRTGLLNLYLETNIPESDILLIGELVLPDSYRYVGNIYGGNTYEDKTRSSYIEIGNYKEISDFNIQIDSPGDTYVQTFKIGRLLKTDVVTYSSQAQQLSEILSYTVETSVNLENRNDLSLQEWTNKFQPRYDEYHQYNRVYSQQPTLIENQAESFKFKKTKIFDNRVISSKLKVPGETIDSWTDILENEYIDLDGKYGPINGLGMFNDNIYTFQDKGIASLSINPRVQVQGSDGIDIELGTGNILYDYNYLTTESGSINKWSIVSTKKGIYYYDILNKAVGRIPDYSKITLSDAKGMHSFFNENYDYDSLKIDNPILKSGAVFGFDNYNNDVYFTLHQGDKSFTWCFNEAKEDFIDLKTYIPSTYINTGEKLILPNTDSNTLWEQYKGEYNNFFGEYQPSYVILQINPESDYECVFNNIHYNSELYLDDIDQPNKTLTHIHAYNEYQDSGRIPLIVGRGSNIRRKFREWQAEIPRDKRARIRNTWIFLKLELDNTNNYKMILHDILVKYSI